MKIQDYLNIQNYSTNNFGFSRKRHLITKDVDRNERLPQGTPS